MSEPTLFYIFGGSYFLGCLAIGMAAKHQMYCNKRESDKAVTDTRIETKLDMLVRVFDVLESSIKSQEQNAINMATMREQIGEIKGELGDRESGIRGILHKIPGDFSKLNERIARIEERTK